MPCCAFAAFIIGNLILAFAAVKRVVLGSPPAGSEERNAAVEWRLDSPPAPSIVPAPRWAWLQNRRAVRGVALAAALEVLIILGAVYGFMEHFGHGAHEGHAMHVQEVQP